MIVTVFIVLFVAVLLAIAFLEDFDDINGETKVRHE